jgi:hypothetical protein
MADNKRQRPISAFFSSTKKPQSRSSPSEPEVLTTNLASGDGMDNENSSSSPETSIDSANLSTNVSQAPNDISHTATDKPSQPILSSFPKTNNRSFQSTWYKGYPWLEYSVASDSCYCFVCRHYSTNDSVTRKFKDNTVSWLFFQFVSRININSVKVRSNGIQ